MGAVIAFLAWLLSTLRGEKSDADAKAAAERQREQADRQAAAEAQAVANAERGGTAPPGRVQHELDDGTF